MGRKHKKITLGLGAILDIPSFWLCLETHCERFFTISGVAGSLSGSRRNGRFSRYPGGCSGSPGSSRKNGIPGALEVLDSGGAVAKECQGHARE